MKSILNCQNYVEFLKELYFEKTQKDHHYSLKEFAQSLGLDSSNISKILSEKRGLSKANAQNVAKILFQTQTEKDHFIDLVTMKHGRSKMAREQAAQKVLKRLQNQVAKLGRSELSLMNSWVDYALRQACLIYDISPFKEPKQIAEYLGVSVSEVRFSLKKLMQLGFLEDTGGKLTPSAPYISSDEGREDSNAQNLHIQFMQKAQKAIKKQDVDKRYFATLLMNTNPKKVKSFQKNLRAFIEEFNQKVTAEESGREHVYALGLQFFDIGDK